MTHPLTDEICEQIRDSIPKLRRDEHGHIFSHDGQRILDGMVEEMSEDLNAEMRSAADWQLEQVIEWLKEKEYDQLDYDEIIYADDLRKAMRPVTQENRND